VRGCQVCQKHLVYGARPVLSVHPTAKILLVSQAPGMKVHRSGIPWQDPSGNRLREWMSVDNDTFYDSSKFAILPMGLCYPGKGPSGDLPPRPECAPLWHQEILGHMPDIQLIILIGRYAQKYYLKDCKSSLTETVRSWKEYLPQYLSLPHPSPRNLIWTIRNPWFAKEIIPYLKRKVRNIIK